MYLTAPFLPDVAVEASASALLAAHARRAASQIRPPVPVESILQDHLRLHLGFDDLRTSLGVPDVLGALYMDSGEVVIDQTLDPDEHSSALGRYRFTLAHEIGHWELHRALFAFQQRQDDLFAKPAAPSIVCRTSQGKERIEQQADAFAAALLMPRSEVITHWQRLTDGRIGIRPGATRDDLIEIAVRPMAEVFEVSAQAMRIRLEGLGCCRREIDGIASLFEAG
jgi:hypothetical protein